MKLLLPLILCSLLTFVSAEEGDEMVQPFQDYKIPDGLSIPKPVFSKNGDVFIGKVRIASPGKSVHIPVYTNLEEGIIEYILCLPHGKVHEALLVTDADPLHMSVAMKLAGFQSFEELFPELDEEFKPKPFSQPTPKDYQKSRIFIQLEWKDKTGHHRSDFSRLLLNTKTREAFPSNNWVYTNSSLYQKRYQASLTGDVIGIFADRNALINYIGPFNDGENASGWIVNTASNIPSGTPATLIISHIEQPSSPNNQ